LNDVAKANKKELCKVIDHLPLKVAREMIASAKVNFFFIYYSILFTFIFIIFYCIAYVVVGSRITRRIS